MKSFQAAVVLLALLALAGCSERFTMGEAASADRSPHMIGEAAPAAASRYMAYEHTVTLDVKEARVRPVYEVALAACRDAAAEQCTVLESRVDSGEGASASLKFRAKAAGIKKILAALAEQGGVVHQSTRAEDLAQPITDNAKKLEMLHDYRAKLEALRGRASTSIESLIKVNKELAQVQSDIEALAGEQAHLMQRVEAEILTVYITSASDKPIWSPIGRALTNFGPNLSNAVGGAITAIAYLIPWLPILFALAWGVRKLWTRMRRQKAGA